MFSYGHGSSLVGLLFVGILVVRLIASRRGRGAPSGRPPGASNPAAFFSAPGRRPSGPVGAPPATGSPGHAGIAPGWLPDPSGRHQQRYWSGAAWTDHVMSNGVPGTDPAPVPPGAGGRPPGPTVGDGG